MRYRIVYIGIRTVTVMAGTRMLFNLLENNHYRFHMQNGAAQEWTTAGETIAFLRLFFPMSDVDSAAYS